VKTATSFLVASQSAPRHLITGFSNDRTGFSARDRAGAVSGITGQTDRRRGGVGLTPAGPARACKDFFPRAGKALQHHVLDPPTQGCRYGFGKKTGKVAGCATPMRGDMACDFFQKTVTVVGRFENEHFWGRPKGRQGGHGRAIRGLKLNRACSFLARAPLVGRFKAPQLAGLTYQKETKRKKTCLSTASRGGAEDRLGTALHLQGQAQGFSNAEERPPPEAGRLFPARPGAEAGRGKKIQPHFTTIQPEKTVWEKTVDPPGARPGGPRQLCRDAEGAQAVPDQRRDSETSQSTGPIAVARAPRPGGPPQRNKRNDS